MTNVLTNVLTPCNDTHMNTNTAAVLGQVNDLDILSTPATVKVQASKLRECMVLTDPEFGTPLYWIDHRVRATRNSGQAEFMAHNLETGHFETVRIGGSVKVSVMSA